MPRAVVAGSSSADETLLGVTTPASPDAMSAALLNRPTFICCVSSSVGALVVGGFLDCALGQRFGFEPLVGDRGSASHRAPVGAGREPFLGAGQRLAAGLDQLGDRLVGLRLHLRRGPVGPVWRLRRLVVAPLTVDARRQLLQTSMLSIEQRPG